MDAKFEHSLQLIRETLDSYDRVAVACSFGKDSIVTVHLARTIKQDVPIFSVMTPFKPKETFELMDKVKNDWKLNLKVFQSKETVDPNLHKTDPDKCCYILKVKPTMEAVKDLDAWISGLRKTEGRTRVDYKEIEKKSELVKVNPILHWTEADIWRYSAIHQLPVHPWYELGYRSLGCACCSIPNTDEERGGRWKGTIKAGGECGIHTKTLK